MSLVAYPSKTQREKSKYCIMEVIGPQGQKIAEYVDKPDRLPYQRLEERQIVD